MIRARVAYDGAGETYRFWWNDPGGGFGWRSFLTFDHALAAAVRFVSSRNGGGPVSVSVSSDGVRAVIS